MFSYQISNDYFCIDEDMRKQAPSNTDWFKGIFKSKS